MPRGFKAGGRKKGTPNKATKAREEILAKTRITPLSFMLDTLQSEQSTPEEKKWAAQTAAPYCHPRLTSIDLKALAEINARVEHVAVVDVRNLPPMARDQLKQLLLAVAVKENAEAIDAEFEDVEEGGDEAA